MERLRGSIDLPLNRKGEQEAQDTANQLAEGGGLDLLFSSPLQRASETARRIEANHIKTRYEGTREGLMPWMLGALEGQSVRKVEPWIKWLLKNPNMAAPGMGGTRQGESFESFQSRAMKTWYELRALNSQFPDKSIGAVTHSRNLSLWESFLKYGEVDPKLLIDAGKDTRPAGVYVVDGYELKPWGGGAVLPKLYLIRHGATDLNG